MVELKAKDKWWLLLGATFTHEELKPFAEAMNRANVAIVEAKERVNIPFTTMTPHATRTFMVNATDKL